MSLKPLILLMMSGYCSCEQVHTGKGRMFDTVRSVSQTTGSITDTIKTPQTKASKERYLLDTAYKVSLGKQTLISSGQSSPYITAKIRGYDFDIVADGKDTIYLATRDKNFRTSEGYSIGTMFSQLPSDLRGKLIKEAGWGYYITLSSGWSLGFCEGRSCTDHYPNSNSTVKWIFRRKGK